MADVMMLLESGSGARIAVGAKVIARLSDLLAVKEPSTSE
jgi:hypothetical protein